MLDKLRHTISKGDLKGTSKEIAVIIENTIPYDEIKVGSLRDIRDCCEEGSWSEAEDILEILCIDIQLQDEEEDDS